MKGVKNLLKRPRIVLLLVFLILAVVAIQPNPFARGVAIRGVEANSSAAMAGFKNPDPLSPPMSREVILSINNIPIHNEQDYYNVLSTFTYNMPVEIKTTKGTYRLITKPKYNVTVLPELVPVVENKTVQENVSINGTWRVVNKTVQTVKYVNKTIRKIIGVQDIGLAVYNAPTTNIRKGLDLAGGTRVVLRPAANLSDDMFDLLVSNLRQRLNLYGVSDIIVRKASDLSDNRYVVIEIAGAKKTEVSNLLSKQGKFEARIGNETVFLGGRKDITFVCRSSDCAGIDPRYGCQKLSDGNWMCRFRFSISLSPKAAERQANITRQLDIVESGEEDFLSKTLDLYLDNRNVSSLRIGAELRGDPTKTEVQISGSGVGRTRDEAAYNALEEMKRLQTVLITGSLPTELTISQMKSISPSLGSGFVRNALIVAMLAIGGVFLMVLLRYRNLKIAIPILITLISEVVIVLGFAALIGWNLDLAAIAGLIIVIGTSVDHQIVITDEILSGEAGGRAYNWAERIRRAFFIIMGAYFTTVAAMLPLIKAGAGLLRGFAITTIVGVTIGVLITRPAFAAMAEYLLKE